MTRPETTADDKVIETWESVVAGATFVWIYDRREDKYIQQSVGGRSGSRRLHISRDDRKYNEEQMPHENAHLNPFTNGSLRLIGASTRDELLDTRYHFTDVDLATMFDVRDPALFEEGIRDITSELILRRLLSVAEKVATQAQSEVLRELIATRYPIGGTQKTVREMIEAGDAIGATRSY